jgi:protein-tyrosine-phosphatase
VDHSEETHFRADATDSGKPTVLFVCTDNAVRSALAAALARTRGGDLVRVESAGTEPSAAPSEVAIACLAELGIDDSGHRPTRLTAERIRKADVVVLMAPGMQLPPHDGLRYETWALPDPDGWDSDCIRLLRDYLDSRVQGLLRGLLHRVYA